MRRSSAVLGVGIFLTAVALYLWGLSARRSADAYWVPLGESGKMGEYRDVFGFRIRAGTLVIYHSIADLTPGMITEYVGAEFTSYSAHPPWDGGERSFPPWSEILKGHWALGNEDGEAGAAVPFWAAVAAVAGGTVVWVRVLRKRERKMIEEGRQA